jgi:hypothetical protein
MLDRSAAFRAKRGNKYGATRTVSNGRTFDSKAESRRHSDLILQQRAGQISDLRLQVPFDLSVNGQKIAKYVADFTYVEDGILVVEDVKSKATITPAYRLKKKLMKALHGIDIRETG